jgi:hypothetical protein
LDRASPESNLVGEASGDAAPRRPVHPCTKETT